MGTQCSNLIDSISTQTPTRHQILGFVSNPKTTHQNHQQIHDFDLASKLQFIKLIENQFVKQNDPNLSSFQKYPENKFIVNFKNGSHYRGYINHQGKRQKDGQQTWQDGTKYIGLWVANLPHGNGILISPEGYTFQGNWNQGVVQGVGKYFGKIGSYQGEWHRNQPHGQGVQTWEDGSKYEGTYFQGKKHGKGKYTWPDKSTYTGDWLSGQIAGQGIYRYRDGRVYTGSFKHNKMHGKGTYTWPDGRKYIGYYENDKKSGKGRYIWPDGRYFEGEWSDGKRNGYGKVVYPNQVVKYGIWEDDQKIEEAVQVVKNLKQDSIERQDETNDYELQQSPTFSAKNQHKNKQKIQRSLSAFPDNSSTRARLTLPRTQPRPLYAQEFSPYKHLKSYYEHYTAEKGLMNQRVANRYKFIESPLRKFNEMQLTGGGSYLQMMMHKRLHSREKEMRLSMGKRNRDKGKTSFNRDTHRRRDSAFL